MWSDHQSLIFYAYYKNIKLNVWILSSLIPSSFSTLNVICDAVDKSQFSFQKNQRITENLFQVTHIWSRWFQRTNFKGLFPKSCFHSHIINFCFVHVVWVSQKWSGFYWRRFHFETARGSSLWRERATRLLSEYNFLSAALFRVLNQFGELMNCEWSVKASLTTLSCSLFSFIRRSGCAF